MKTLSLLSFAAVTLFLVSACHTIECGDGTVEKDGTCVAINFVTSTSQPKCNPGSVWLESENACVVDVENICGPGTEIVWDDENTFHCESTGASDLPVCDPANQTGDNICITGYVTYMIDPLDESSFLTSTVLDASALASLEVIIYDPLDYAVEGEDSVPLGVGMVDVTTGTFVANDVPVPSNGYVGIVVRDAGWTGADFVPQQFPFTGMAYQAVAGTNLEGKIAPAITKDQLDNWNATLTSDYLTASGNCPEGDLYGCGVWIGIYREKESLVSIEGVEPVRRVTPIPQEQLAYIDTDESGDYNLLTLGTDRRYTSETGVAMYFGADLSNYLGLCSVWADDETANCHTLQMQFPSSLQGGSAKGAIFLQYVNGTSTAK